MICLAAGPNSAEIVTAVAAVATALAAILATGYASKQIATARKIARVELTFRLYEHQLDPEFANRIALTSDFVTIDGALFSKELVAKQRWWRWNRMRRDKKMQILLYLNHLEAVGGLYEAKRLDRKSAMELFGATATAYWGRADWFVQRLQAEKPAAFEKWGKLVEEYRLWKEGQKAHRDARKRV